jgi:hypothetical protein
MRPGQISGHQNTKSLHFIPECLKMVSCGKGSFFATTKNWLNISFYLFIQTEVMDYIYYFYKSEMVLFEVLQRSSEREKVSQFAYITCAGSTRFLPYAMLFCK